MSEPSSLTPSGAGANNHPDQPLLGVIEDNISITSNGQKVVSEYGSTNRSFFDRTFSSLEPGSVRGSVFTLASTAIGAGVLSLPLVLKNCGLILGLVLVGFGGVLALFSLELLVVTSNKTKHRTYSELTAALFSPRVGTIMECTLVVYCFGSCLAYLVVIGNSIVSVLHALDVTNGIFANRDFDLTLITCIIAFPLCLMRDVSGLRYASIVAVLSMLYMSFTVVYRGASLASMKDEHDVAVPLATVDWKIFSSTTITWFAYTCHGNVLQVYNELQNPLVRRMRKVMWRSLYLEFALYGCVSLFGFLSFHQATKGNILENYDASDVMIIVARICVAASLTVAVPINMHPCRQNLELVLFKGKPFSMVRHVVVTILLVVPCLLLAIVAPGVSTVFGLLGATCCVFMCYVIPILAYIKVFNNELSSYRKNGLLLALVLIVLIGGASVVDNVMSLVNGSN